jgi:MFS family permease
MGLKERPLVIAMCVGQLGTLLTHVAVPAVMPQHLMPAWHQSATEAGMMASAFAFGCMIAVPLLTTLTDRIDARLILLAGSAATSASNLAVCLFADGLWSATIIWGLVSIGFAVAYMPGLKALTDRLGRRFKKRYALHVQLFLRRRLIDFCCAPIAAKVVRQGTMSKCATSGLRWRRPLH